MFDAIIILAYIFISRFFTSERDYERMIREEIDAGLCDGSIDVCERR
jgi:hypothetical protein